MRTSHLIWVPLAALLLVGIGVPATRAIDVPFTEEFFLDECDLSSRGVNDYFLPLKPKCWLLLQGDEDDGEGGTVTITVFIRILPQTRVVDGVRCAIMREMEWEDDELVEVSWNYVAICRDCRDVYYFGEDVDIYEDGEVVSHGGAWLAGVGGAKPGLLMPGCPLIGSRYYQEIAEGIALDRAEHLDNNATILTPAGTFEHCLYAVETTPLEPGNESFKGYARHIGLVLDDVIRLVDFGRAGPDFDPGEEEEEE